jgi:hypothetical protein
MASDRKIIIYPWIKGCFSEQCLSVTFPEKKDLTEVQKAVLSQKIRIWLEELFLNISEVWIDNFLNWIVVLMV